MKKKTVLMFVIMMTCFMTYVSCGSNSRVVESVPVAQASVTPIYYEEQYQRWKELFKEKQYDEAMVCLNKAAEGNLVEALNDLAYHYYEGSVYPHNTQLAEQCARRGAEKGNLNCQLRLGRILRDTGRKKEALEWIVKSAEQGQGWAAYLAGEMFENGEGAPKNRERAIYWYKEAAKKDWYATCDDAKDALKRMGVLLYDENEYMQLVNQYMTQTGESAENLYSEGKYWKHDYRPQQLACLLMSAELGYPKAAKELSDIYSSKDAELYGFYDATKSDYWLVKAYDGFVEQMKSGDVDAMYEIGQMYYRGTGFLEKNMELAEHCFRTGAEKGHDACQLWLGIILHDSNRKEEAFRWLVKSGAQDQGWAAYLVGEMYEKGEGVSADLNKAIEWYTKSAQTYNKYAIDARNALRRLGQPVPHNSLYDD